jgi:hypothetical protein
VVLQEHAEAQKKKLDDPPPKPQHKDETIWSIPLFCCRSSLSPLDGIKKKFSSPNTQFVVCINRLSSHRLLRTKPQNTKRRQALKNTPTKKDVAKNKGKKRQKEREHRY